MLNVVKFKADHVFKIETNFDLPKSFKDAFQKDGQVDAFTVMQGETVVALGGIHVLWNGVGEGFCMLSKHSDKWQTSIARYAKNMFEGIIENNGLHRVQASIHEKDPEAIRFAKWLGFENEGIMLHYGPDGSNYYRMSMVL
tara:strand:- start:1325 stop:1747 length:423 start_codon:yes stop_codon:yes gene_type:complete